MILLKTAHFTQSHYKLRFVRFVATSISPALREVRKYMDKYPDKIVLTELGKFYELYFENADVYGPKLNLKVSKRSFSKTKVSMAGFPVQYCFKYIDQLVNTHNIGVVLVKQYVKNPWSVSSSRKFYRKVHRIITPGTIVEPDMLDQEKNNFILMVVFPKEFDQDSEKDPKIGLSWCDISTTELFVQESSLSGFINDVHRIKPSEIIVDEKYKERLSTVFNIQDKFNFTYVSRLNPDKHFNYSKYYSIFSERRTSKIDNTLDSLKKLEKASMFILIEHIKNQLDIVEEIQVDTDTDTQPSCSLCLSLPLRNNTSQHILIDTSARDALELVETIRRKSTKNTLFSTMKRTITPSGSRTLRNWINSPPYDLQESKRRLKIVKTFTLASFEPSILKLNSTLTKLSQHDPLRLLFTISFNSSLLSSTSHDHTNLKIGWNYINLLKVLQYFTEIRETLKAHSSNAVINQFVDEFNIPQELVDKIRNDINSANIEKLQDELAEMEETSIDQPQFSFKRTGFPDMTWIININSIDSSSPLSVLHKQLETQLQKKKALESKMNTILKELKLKSYELRIDNDIPNIYIQHSAKVKITTEILQNHFENVSVFKQSKTTENFTIDEWNSLGFKITKLIRQVRYEESKYLNLLRNEVVGNFQTIKFLAQSVDYIDVLLSFAKLSKEFNLVCPTLTKKPIVEIVKGRHLTVEASLRTNFADFEPNDCYLASSEDYSLGHIISGPNMGGKSTYLRQNAIIIILAHLGCFVPAKSATIGLVDKIFTRIGSADDISNNSSTFMVEMEETSHGLNNATKNSFLIFDEIGRGTSNKEGIAIAFAILKYLVENVKCRFLFATHYAPELKELIEQFPSVSDQIKYYHTTLMSQLLESYLQRSKSKRFANQVFNARFFDHKLIPGVSKYSHATTVAQLAGVPQKVVDSAQELLDNDKM